MATTTQTRPAGPFSSLINYDEERKRIEQQKKDQEARQQKIARTNSIGEAFRLIIDAAGGSRGATIVPREVNPGILRATERYDALNKEYKGDVDRLRLQELAAREKDESLRQGTLAEERGQKFDLAKMDRAYQMDLDKMAREDAARREQLGLQGANAIEIEKLRGKNAINLENTRNRGDLEQIRERLAKDVDSMGGFYVARYDDPNQMVPLKRESIMGLFRNLREYLLSTGQVRSEYQLPVTLQEGNEGNVSNDDLTKLIVNYPDFFAKQFPQLTGGQPLPEPVVLTPEQRRYQRYVKQVDEIYNNLEMKPKQRLRAINKLNKNNPDMAEMLKAELSGVAGKPAESVVITPNKEGVTDLSTLFN